MLRTLVYVAAIAVTTSSVLQERINSSRALPATERQMSSVDSIVLERSSCYGSCPSYRLMIDSIDVVHFTSLSTADSGKQYSAPSTPSTNARLYLIAKRIHFGELPDSIVASALCGPRVTDEQSVEVGIYGSALRKRVVHYRGCIWSPKVLFDFEDAIDSLANSRRWTLSRPPA